MMPEKEQKLIMVLVLTGLLVMVSLALMFSPGERDAEADRSAGSAPVTSVAQAAE